MQASKRVWRERKTVRSFYFHSIDPNPGQDALEHFALRNASFHVWPYWREYLANQCRRMNLPPVMLPMRQFASPTDNPPDDSP